MGQKSNMGIIILPLVIHYRYTEASGDNQTKEAKLTGDNAGQSTFIYMHVKTKLRNAREMVFDIPYYIKLMYN